MRIPHLALLIKCASKASYKVGDFLFRKGDPADGFFLIKSGSVALEGGISNGARGPKAAHAGDVLGHGWLASPAIWPVSARALELTSVIVLSVARLKGCANENPDFGNELMKRAAPLRIESFQSSAAALTLEHVDPIACWESHFEGGTKNTGNAGFFPGDTLDMDEAEANHLSLRDGEWVQLTARHGTAILPIRIKHHKTDERRSQESRCGTASPVGKET